MIIITTDELINTEFGKHTMHLACYLNKPLINIEKMDLIQAGVGQRKFPPNYIIEDSGDNIAYKNQHYSETSFWFEKNAKVLTWSQVFADISKIID